MFIAWFIFAPSQGDLATKKIYPTLWWLYRDGLLPDKTYFIGYGRTELTIDDIRGKSLEYMKVRENHW